MPTFQNKPVGIKGPQGPVSESQLQLQNAVKQFMVLKNAQNQLASEKVSQNAATFLDCLCQPAKHPLAVQGLNKSSELAPQLAKLRQQLQAAKQA